MTSQQDPNMRVSLIKEIILLFKEQLVVFFTGMHKKKTCKSIIFAFVLSIREKAGWDTCDLVRFFRYDNAPVLRFHYYIKIKISVGDK